MRFLAQAGGGGAAAVAVEILGARTNQANMGGGGARRAALAVRSAVGRVVGKAPSDLSSSSFLRLLT